MGITRANSHGEDSRAIHVSLFYPRIWKIMVLAAYPFLLLGAGYFEALERTGTIGAFFADTLMPITLIGYAALLFVLKKRGW